MSIPMGYAHLATVTRGSEPDTLHFGAACLADAEGKVLWSIGDAEVRVFFRSSSKPMQALPLVFGQGADGRAGRSAADVFGFTGPELAIICGSHAGGPAQIAQVQGILAKAGLSPDLLQCGIGLPDNCSGKHAGMLAACRHLGYSLEGYCDPQHPLQKLILETLSEYCGLKPSEVVMAVDGCSAPTFLLPLRRMAQGFARLAKGVDAPAGPSGRLCRAMVENPGGHTGEPDMRPFPVGGETPITKGGANGIQCAAFPALGLGFACKTADGSSLPRWPVFIAALERAGQIDRNTADRMHLALAPKIETRRGLPAGAISAAF